MSQDLQVKHIEYMLCRATIIATTLGTLFVTKKLNEEHINSLLILYSTSFKHFLLTIDTQLLIDNNEITVQTVVHKMDTHKMCIATHYCGCHISHYLWHKLSKCLKMSICLFELCNTVVSLFLLEELVGWLIGWLVCWLVCWKVCWFVCCLKKSVGGFD